MNRTSHHPRTRVPRPASRASLALLAWTLVAVTLVPLALRRAAAAEPLAVYGDALADGWTNCSWDATVDVAAGEPVYSGSHALRLTVTAPRGGLCLRAGRAVDGTAFTGLRFAARAGAGDRHYQVFLYDTAMQPTGYMWLANAGGDPRTDAWMVYTIPLTALGAAGRLIQGIGVQEIDTGSGTALFLDDIAFVTAPSTPTSTGTSSLPEAALPVYQDALAPGWTNCSWGGAVNMAVTAPVYAGTRAAALTPSVPRAGLCLMADRAIDTSSYSVLRFAARTARDGLRYQVFLYDATGASTGVYLWLSAFTGDPGAAAWHEYAIPLAMLGGTGRQIKGLAIQEIDETVGQTLFVDEIALVATAPATASAPAPTPTTPLALGAYVAGVPTNPKALDDFAAMVGVMPAVVMWYVGWGTSSPGAFDHASMESVTARGAVPMVTWMPWESEALGVNQPAFALRTIIAGAHDAYIRQWARDAAAWGKPLYLRFAHEMNGSWYPWSPGVNGNTSAEFVAAWRHVHDLFRQEGATNVRWVWSPNVIGPGSGPFADMYPGDDYVDWVALGGYNWGPSGPYRAWLSLTELFAYSYDVLTTITTKPVMIAETASSEVGGDKAAWITQGLLTDVLTRMPRVRAVVWFHEQKEADWRVNSSSAALAAFRQVAASAAYRGRLP